MTTEQTTVASALQSALNPARFQLGIALGKVDGTAKTAVEAAVTMVNQVEELTIEQYNKEVDNYNELCDLFEMSELKLAVVRTDLSDLTNNVNTIKSDAANTKLQGEKDITAANIAHSKMKNLRDELKSLRAMEPEKMKNKIAEQRKKLDERLALLDEQRLKIRELKSNFTSSETDCMALLNRTTTLEGEVKELRGRLNYHDGDVEQKVYFGKDGLEMYLYTFAWGLSFKPASPDIQIINDISWHMEVRTNYGICVLVSVTEWLAPFYPPCDYLADRWDCEIHNALVGIINDRLELSHPHLYDRVEWAKETYLEDAGLQDKHVAALNAAGFHSLYSVLHVPPARLVNLIKEKSKHDDEVKTAAKGFGDAAARQVYKQLNKMATEWESNHPTWQPVNQPVNKKSA